MHSVKQQVVHLIHEYQAAVFRAVALLNAKSAQEKGLHLQEKSPGGRTGYLDAQKQGRYAFYGTGCLVTLPGG